MELELKESVGVKNYKIENLIYELSKKNSGNLVLLFFLKMKEETIMLLKKNSNTVTSIANEEETIVLHISEGEYYGLEGAHKEIWDNFNQNLFEKKSIVEEFLSKFDNSKEEIQKLVDESVMDLINYKLIMVVDKYE